jgi:hypothetical protein
LSNQLTGSADLSPQVPEQHATNAGILWEPVEILARVALLTILVLAKESTKEHTRLAIQPKLLPRGPCQYFNRLLEGI